jgi:hypothetical protein
MAFYANGCIQTHVARMRYREDLVIFTESEADARAKGTLSDQLIGAANKADLASGTREEGKQFQVFLLSGPDDPETIRLPQPIVNDTVAESGRPWPWTMGQRYVSLTGLTRPGIRVTSDLSSS